MKIVISTDGDMVSGHFGRCPQFTIVDSDESVVRVTDLIENPGHSPGYLPRFFYEMGVECIIAGGMGMSAQHLFKQYNIEQILGISGKISDVVTKLQNGTLEGGESDCKPGGGKGYGVDKTVCDHGGDE